MRPKIKRLRRLRPPLLSVARNMGKFKPQDDFLLIQGVLQLNDLGEVKNLTKFTRGFTLKELKERWYAILYDGPISKLIYKNIKKLHVDDVLRLKRLAPYSNQENKLLIEINSQPKSNEFFKNFLLENKTKLYDSRSPESLETQWQLLKDLQLLTDQKTNTVNDNDSLEITFNELEDRLNDEVILNNVEVNEPDEDSEMARSYSKVLHEIKRAEADLFLWQILVDKITKRENPFVEADTLAILFSEQIEYQMKKKQIILGRSRSNDKIDIDLSLIKLDKRVSRVQCSICHVQSDLFYLSNRGKLTVFIDGKPVLVGCKLLVHDKSLIEVGDITMMFLVNYSIISRND